jgi:hypothetical protein
MKKLCQLMILLLVSAGGLSAQTSKGIDAAGFFMDEKPFEMTLSSDLKNLLTKRMQKEYQPATVTFRFADSTVVTEVIRIQTRGKFRLENCTMPPIGMNFKNESSPLLKSLGKLKLVCGCASTNDDEQLIIKEYMAYKIYNMLTEKSFRVRLVKINYDDTRGKIKKYSQYGFLLEDVDEMAARNNCVEVEGTKYDTEATNRAQMTMVAIFEYMIGNTDWSVPVYHNIKLMRPENDPAALPIAVPYDLNHCGVVDANYAAPPEELGIKSVRDRLYRGFPRSMEELDAALQVFKNKKEAIYGLVNNCEWLSNKYKKDITNYLNEFYKVVENKNQVKREFIDGARTQ